MATLMDGEDHHPHSLSEARQEKGLRERWLVRGVPRRIGRVSLRFSAGSLQIVEKTIGRLNSAAMESEKRTISAILVPFVGPPRRDGFH